MLRKRLRERRMGARSSSIPPPPTSAPDLCVGHLEWGRHRDMSPAPPLPPSRRAELGLLVAHVETPGAVGLKLGPFAFFLLWDVHYF